MTQKLTAAQMRGVYELFNEHALEDQRRYYKSAVDRYRRASIWANRLRALAALVTGLAAAVVGLLLSVNQTCFPTESAIPAECTAVRAVVDLSLLGAVIAPAVGAAFTTLIGLYQWDRMIALYESALENLDVADAQSPIEDMDDAAYYDALLNYAGGTLMVMSDETAQWGQLTKPPQTLIDFVDKTIKVDTDTENEPPADNTP
ncbi:MAG: hypothetical protein IAE80_12895 [Anaerolinea sp.]|nr:hypothetical protein [Anaerolinea sp.]